MAVLPYIYEDDNITIDYQQEKCVKTNYRWKEDEGGFYIDSAEGETDLIVEKKENISVVLKDMPVNETVVLCLKGRVWAENEIADRCFRILERAQISFDLKEKLSSKND